MCLFYCFIKNIIFSSQFHTFPVLSSDFEKVSMYYLNEYFFGDLSKVGDDEECKTGEHAGDGINDMLLFVPSFGVEFDDCDFLC